MCFSAGIAEQGLFMTNNVSLFRKEALQEITSPEQLDQLIQVVTPRAWLAAGSVYAILLFLILWSFLGSVPTRADGYGILLAGGGDVYSAVAPDGPSRVQKFLANPGDRVSKDQPLAILSRPDLAEEIQLTEKYLAALQNKYTQLLAESQEKIATRQKQTTEQQVSEQRAIENGQTKAENLRVLLANREEGFRRGIETRQNVSQTTQEYYNAKNEIENLSNQLVQAQIAQDNFVDQWREQLRTLQMKIDDENLKFSNLKKRLNLSTELKAPIAGVITHIPLAIGSIANIGTPLVNIASEGSGLDALIYVPAQLGKQLKAGMRAQVTPTTVEKAEFGSIDGKVVSVSPFPATPEAIQAALQNQDLVKKFTEKEPPIEVRIRLQNNLKTFSGLKWSSAQGPRQAITPGTLANAMITIREQAPITLFIPALKKLMGIQ
jgi:HlyD family secretion protein